MEKLFERYRSGQLTLANRFVFPPIKTAYGGPDGKVTPRQLAFYRRISKNGPGIVVLEPVAVTADGREHPKQLCVHLPDSAGELKKIVEAIHGENRLACLHLNHAGAAANPMVIGGPAKAPSPVACPSKEQSARALSSEEIERILEGYRSAAEKAVRAGFDLIEIQAGHGYLISQFLNGLVNKRGDRYGRERLAFAEEALAAVREGAPDIPFMVRISGDEMSAEFGIARSDLSPFLGLAESKGAWAVHVGMGSSCFSPPWYFHHASLPEQPQLDALSWVRRQCALPVIAAGRMGRIEKVNRVLEKDLADLIALGRPLLADPDLIEKWRRKDYDGVRACGYCLQGCLHRMKNKQPLGCNLNPEIGLPELTPTAAPKKVLVAGGGPAGLSAAACLARKGHRVILAEKSDRLGGQFELAWKAPGKESMRMGLEQLKREAETKAESVLTNTPADVALMEKVKPDLLVWAVGAVPFIPRIEGLETQNAMTAVDFFNDGKKIAGPRVLIVGAGRTGLEIAEALGKSQLQVTATKRTDPVGSMMEAITRKLILMRLDRMENVKLVPRTTILAFSRDGVAVETDGEKRNLEPFQTVILASGMRPASGPSDEIKDMVAEVVAIGDAEEVRDIFSAVHAGYELALRY